MAAGINRYKADLRELNFVLLEQFGLGEVVGKAVPSPVAVAVRGVPANLASILPLIPRAGGL